MLAGIQNAGGIRALKKVDRTQIRDRSEAQVGGRSADTGPAGSGLPPAGATGGGGNVAGSLALMVELQKRKEKVSKSGMFLSPHFILCLIIISLSLSLLTKHRQRRVG